MEKLIVSKSTAGGVIERSPKTIDRLINRGELEAVVQGREIFVTWESIQDYVKRLPRLKARTHPDERAVYGS